MQATLTYLYDPLCGWCYGATAVLPRLIDATRLKLVMLPTGMFAGSGAQVMDEEFAAYAWANDQRIARLTGQVFSDRYRTQVLENRQQGFDSGPATMALTAVHLTAPDREADALKVIQLARYVDARDINQVSVLAAVLADAGLHDASRRTAQPDDVLLQATQTRMALGLARMRQLGASGVPTFVVDDGKRARVLHSSAIFSNPDFQNILGTDSSADHANHK